MPGATIISLRSLRDVAFCAVAIALITFVLFDEDRDLEGLLISLEITGTYVAIIWSAQLGAGLFAERFIPLDTRRAVAIRVAIHAVVMAVTFIAATLLLRELFHYAFLWNRWSMTTIALIVVCATLVGHGSHYLRAFYERAREAEQAALNAQLRALRAQINPHFLFNSLNSIAALIRTRPQDAERVTESLADLFRYSLRASEQPTVTLAEELASLEHYLDIERTRFGDRLRVTVAVPAGLTPARMPSLLLQPLVENAVKHGAESVDGECTIAITGSLDGGSVRLVIADSGPGFGGMTLAAAEARGMGLANVRARLRGQFGDAAALVLAPEGVIVTFPFEAAGPTPGASSDDSSHASDHR